MTDKSVTSTDFSARRAVLATVRAHLSSLQPADARVAQVILDQPNVVIYQSATEVAEAASTSSATVVRCTQALGFKGFHDMKLALAQDLAVFDRSTSETSISGDLRLSALEQVVRAGAESVRDAGGLVDPASFATVADLLAAAGKVLFAGVGTSAPLCQDAAYRFAAIGIQTDSPLDSHVQHVKCRMLEPNDVCVVISHTGSTRESVEFARTAASAGASTVAITSFARSPLTEIVDHTILAGSRELSFRLESMASRLAHLAILDALLVAVAGLTASRSTRVMQLYTEVISEHRF